MADLILYDGVCGLCNRLNPFILKRDSADRFRFASLQGSLAHDNRTRAQLVSRDGMYTSLLRLDDYLQSFTAGRELEGGPGFAEREAVGHDRAQVDPAGER